MTPPPRDGGTLSQGPDYDGWFEQATGNSPYAYQRALAEAERPPSVLEVPTGSGQTRFRSSKAGTSRLDRASLVGARVEFPEPVRGPIVLGALSHYGLGLFVPAER